MILSTKAFKNSPQSGRSEGGCRGPYRCIRCMATDHMKGWLYPVQQIFVLKKVENLKSKAKSLRKGEPTKNAI